MRKLEGGRERVMGTCAVSIITALCVLAVCGYLLQATVRDVENIVNDGVARIEDAICDALKNLPR